MEAAAITIIFDEKDKVLLLKRMHPQKDFSDYWGFPGGTVNPNETNEQAAVRETKEETNLDIWNLKFLRSERDFIQAYTTRNFKGDIQLSFEHVGYVWESIENLSNYKLIPGSVELIKEAAIL
tara:strand:+ start:1176 stop:1544 length:369 start_codon:yes stop_codon:yes gene_type:complete